MTDTIKEIFTAFSQRINSPFFGYIIIAFVAINWKAAYYLLFSGKPALAKFLYVDANTGWITLAALPLTFGVLTALAAPWVSYWGAIWAESPTNNKRMRAVKAANEVSKLKNLLREEQNREVAAIIESFKQDSEVQEIQDDETRNKLQEQIDEIRNQPKNLLEAAPTSNNESIKTRIEMYNKQAELAFNRGEERTAQELYMQAEKLIKNL